MDMDMVHACTMEGHEDGRTRKSARKDRMVEAQSRVYVLRVGRLGGLGGSSVDCTLL